MLSSVTVHESPLFPGLFEGQPALVRSFLELALHLRDLNHIYSEARASQGAHLSRSILSLLDIELAVSEKDLSLIPTSGPVVVVANHPYGFLDGMLLDSLLLRVRPDVKILTNRLISELPELRERCLPVDVFAGAGQNVGSLRRVMQQLRRNGGVAFFPAGEVSHWQTSKRCITDPRWSLAPVRCAGVISAPIVPVFFSGENSLGFQLMGMIHPRLRTARLPGELINKRGRRIEVRIGTPVRPSELQKFQTLEEATDYVRARTYTLGHRSGPTKAAPKPVSFPLRPRVEAIAAPQSPSALAAEIAQLMAAEPGPVLDNADYCVLAARGDRIPALLNEIGRLREITFRQAGEGSRKARDLDTFDAYYTHLILWSKKTASIAGGYRLAWTADVLPHRGINGLYTSTLFRFHPHFFEHLGSAMELGRSFVHPDFQRDYAPLLLLWQGIARMAAQRPDSPVLFGPVSISADYSEASRELIVQFVSERSFRKDLAGLAVPRHAFRSRLTSSADLRIVVSCLEGVEDLAAPLSDIDNASGVPVLLRQYLKLGGKVAGFNLDRKFSNALDGLLIVDLRETSPKMLNRYMGPELSARFLRAACPPRSA